MSKIRICQMSDTYPRGEFTFRICVDNLSLSWFDIIDRKWTSWKQYGYDGYVQTNSVSEVYSDFLYQGNL